MPHRASLSTRRPEPRPSSDSPISRRHPARPLAAVLFLLFEMGLELNTERLSALARFAFGVGLPQVLLTAGAFAWLSSPPYSIGEQVLETVFNAPAPLVTIRTMDEAVVIGAALSLSSSAFVLQLLQERGELPTRYGAGALGVLLMQDIVVVPLLVLLPLIEAAGGIESDFGSSGLLAEVRGEKMGGAADAERCDHPHCVKWHASWPVRVSPPCEDLFSIFIALLSCFLLCCVVRSRRAHPCLWLSMTTLSRRSPLHARTPLALASNPCQHSLGPRLASILSTGWPGSAQSHRLAGPRRPRVPHSAPEGVRSGRRGQEHRGVRVPVPPHSRGH